MEKCKYNCYQISTVNKGTEWDDLVLFNPYTKSVVIARYYNNQGRITDEYGNTISVIGKVTEESLTKLSTIPIYLDNMPAVDSDGCLSTLLDHIEPIGNTIKLGDVIVVELNDGN